MPPAKRVDAKVVEIDHTIEPLDAVVVGDKRNNFGKRLGVFALVILILFFAINDYISSSQNGKLLRRAAADRSNLVHSVADLTKSNAAQTRLIKQLQKALRTQNRELGKAGFQTVRIPGDNSTTSSSHPSSKPTPSPQPGHSPKPTPRPTPRPTHTPRPPPPNSVNKVKKRICSLTGICTIDITKWFIF